MMKYIYNGSDEQVFPSLGLVLNKGDEFEAPDSFSHADCSPAGKGFSSKIVPSEPSAATDPKVGVE